MKKIVYTLFFLASMAASSQDYYTNDPVRADVIMNSFVSEAESRGIEVRERLKKVNKLLFVKNGQSEHWHSNGLCTIKVGYSQYSTEWELIWNSFHEIGHHMGLPHCRLCSFNIMAEIKDSVPHYFKQPMKQLYLDLFFEQIRNPSNPHKHY